MDEVEGTDIAVSWTDVSTAAEKIRRGRLAARQKRALQLHGQLSAEQAEDTVCSARNKTVAGSNELAGRGDLLVNVLEASMLDCFGLLVLQQVIKTTLSLIINILFIN